MHINVQAISEDVLIKPNEQLNKQSERIRQKVGEIRIHQLRRQGCLNAHLSPKNM